MGLNSRMEGPVEWHSFQSMSGRTHGTWSINYFSLYIHVSYTWYKKYLRHIILLCNLYNSKNAECHLNKMLKIPSGFHF